MKKPYTLERRAANFWKRVDKSGGDNACWEWGGRTHKNYGTWHWNGVTEGAHRIAYRLSTADPADRLVLHSCDNPICCNPKHLRLGTHADNSLDRDLKRRGKPPVNKFLMRK